MADVDNVESVGRGVNPLDKAHPGVHRGGGRLRGGSGGGGGRRRRRRFQNP